MYIMQHFITQTIEQFGALWIIVCTATMPNILPYGYTSHHPANTRPSTNVGLLLVNQSIYQSIKLLYYYSAYILSGPSSEAHKSLA